MIKVLGLWLHEGRDGKKMLTGNFAGVRVVILRNKYKKTDKHPDYQLFIDENKKPDNSPDGDLESSELEMVG